jgi:hypothetical protein
MDKLNQGALPPKARTIQLPADLKPQCWYQVLVSFHVANPAHKALLYTGFLNGIQGGPGGYHMLVSSHWDYDDNFKIGQLHYLEVLQDLGKLT